MPAARLTGWALLARGLTNTNLRLEFDRPPHRAVLRLHQRGREAARKEAAIAALIGGRVPQAELLHDGSDDMPPWSLLALAPGTSLDIIAAGLDEAALRQAARAVGRVMAGWHAIDFPQAGFFGPALRISPIDMGAGGLRGYVDRTVRHGAAGPRLGATLSGRLLTHVAAHAERLEAWACAPCLVHGDCNPSNILLRPAAGSWAVTAVLDWEYALSAYPPLDVGTLLRAPLGPRPGFADGLAEGYVEAGRPLPADWRRIALLADVFAWADILSSPDVDAARIADGRAAIAGLLAAG